MAAIPTVAAAQIVRIPTVAVAPAGYQFDIFPTVSAAMGGVSIAVEDRLLDPFVNPAKGTRMEEPRLYSSIGFFGDTDEVGGGWTLPLAATGRSGAWFGGLAFGLQGMEMGEDPGESPPIVVDDCLGCRPPGRDLSQTDPTPRNRYGFAMLGRELENVGLSVGASVLWSGLEAVDGVAGLYPGSVRLQQSGGLLDLRLGALEQWAGDRTLEVLVLHRRFHATHEALYFDPFWDPALRQATQRSRVERTSDRTSLWGLHVEYERPLGDDGWSIGWLGTLNRQSHPALPAYEVAMVSRDRGRSTALELGVGVARSLASSTFGVDLVYEPIWSRTWAAASGPVDATDGTIAAGDEVLENRYRFSNALLRIGVEDEADLSGSDVLGVQFGLVVRTLGYRLSQRDHVLLREQDLRERWVEWTPTWGLSLHTPVLEVRYLGQLTSGIRRPGLAAGPGGACFDVCLEVADPRSFTVVGGPPVRAASDLESVSMHQIAFSFPLGPRRPATTSREEGQEESR